MAIFCYLGNETCAILFEIQNMRHKIGRQAISVIIYIKLIKGIVENSKLRWFRET
jgi:hypothetical protein